MWAFEGVVPVGAWRRQLLEKYTMLVCATEKEAEWNLHSWHLQLQTPICFNNPVGQHLKRQMT